LEWNSYRRCLSREALAADRRSAMVTGTAASVVSTAALGLLAQNEGKSAFQPTNATSHWLHGDRAALQHGVDAAHTLIGYATNSVNTPSPVVLTTRPPCSAISGSAAA
jgi:hypothetical protein